MKNRKQLQIEIDEKHAMCIKLFNQCNNLLNELIDLEFEKNKISDNEFTYEEKTERFKEGRKYFDRLVGRQYWMEGFSDEDTGKIIQIKRSRLVSIDGKPCDILGNIIEKK